MDILTHREFIELFKKSIDLLKIKSLNEEQTQSLKQNLDYLPDFILDEATPTCTWLSGLLESRVEVDEKLMQIIKEKVCHHVVGKKVKIR